MGGAIQDWSRLAQRMFKNTKPGGWVEFQDIDARYYSEDGSLTEQHQTSRWIAGLMQAGEKINRVVSPGPDLEGWVRDAGYTNITHRRFKMPIGPWPSDPHLVRPSPLFAVIALGGRANRQARVVEANWKLESFTDFRRTRRIHASSLHHSARLESRGGPSATGSGQKGAHPAEDSLFVGLVSGPD